MGFGPGVSHLQIIMSDVQPSFSSADKRKQQSEKINKPK